MQLDLEGEYGERAYAVLCALVTPRPIAWVTTIDASGVETASSSPRAALGSQKDHPFR